MPQSGARGFAVVDFETTGLVPERGDRAIEIGVTLLAPDGTIEHEDETLIHVSRDLGPQHVHHIRAADLRNAPEFDGIARQLRDYLAGRVFVAHNVAFDSRVLRSEYARLGYDIPVRGTSSASSTSSVLSTSSVSSTRSVSSRNPAAQIVSARPSTASTPSASSTTLCTMRLGGKLLGVRSLAACCNRFGIGNPDAHSALSDAHATALLLREYMRMIPDWPGWSAHLDAAERAVWPCIGEDMAQWMPRPTHADAGNTFAGTPFVDTPFADAPITERQFAGSVESAGIYSSVNPAGTAHAQATPAPPPRLREGDRIVLTGSMSQRRSDWIDDLDAVGIVVWPSVTRKVRLVVAADVDSESTKARKARDYGIPIVSERWLKTAIKNGVDA